MSKTMMRLAVLLAVPLSAAGSDDRVPPTRESRPPARTDRYGDLLPDGAIGRLGTLRWQPGGQVRALAYSPDGTKIAAVGAGPGLTLWDAATGRQIHSFPQQGQPRSLAFSPNGKILATGDSGGSWGCVWDVSTGRKLWPSFFGQVAITPDGKHVVMAYEGGGLNPLRVWDANTGKEEHSIYFDDHRVYGLAYSPDGKLLALANEDGKIRLWDPITRKKQGQLDGHKGGVYHMAFSPDSRRLASSGGDEKIRLWDPATGKQAWFIDDHLGEYGMRPLAFAPDGALLATGHGDSALCLWDVADGKEKRRWQAGASILTAVTFSPDGKTIASGAMWEGIRIWDAATGREHHPRAGHLGQIDLLRFSADGSSLVSVGRDRRMIWWDMARQMPRRCFSWQGKGALSRTALSPDGSLLAPSCGGIQLWDVRTEKLRRTLRSQERHQIEVLTFSSDGALLAEGSVDPFLRIWEVGSGKLVGRLEEGGEATSHLAFSPAGDVLASASRVFSRPTAYAVHLWDVPSRRRLRSIQLEGSLTALSFSPDGKVLVVASADSATGASTLQLCEVTTGKKLWQHQGQREHVQVIAVSADGSLVAVGAGSHASGDSFVDIRETATGQRIRRFRGHPGSVSCVAFAPDSLTMAIGADDSTILLWDVTGRRGDGCWHRQALTAQELEACWAALADDNAVAAQEALWSLAAAPEQAVPFLRRRLTPAPRVDARRIAGLVADLDSDDFDVREAASKELGELGEMAVPALRQVLEGEPSAEVRQRIRHLLSLRPAWTVRRLREHRAIRALEYTGTKEAGEVLAGIAAGAPGAEGTEQARAALKRLGGLPRR